MTKGNPETCSSTILSTKYPMWAGLGLILSLHDERVATSFWWLISTLLFFIYFVYFFWGGGIFWVFLWL